MAEKNNANIGFEKEIWDAACVLWGHIPAAEYRKVIVGLIFLRYISAAFDKRHKELVEEGDGFEDDIDAYTMENVFFVPEEARWDTIASAAHTPEIGLVIDNAMKAIETDNKTLKDVLPKNYASPDLDKRILGDVVDIFTNSIDMADTASNEYLYLYFKHIRSKLIALGNGSVFTNLKTDILKNYPTYLPTGNVLNKFDNVVKPIFSMILSRTRESKSLVKVRDFLLPKLMSGELDVSNLNL